MGAAVVASSWEGDAAAQMPGPQGGPLGGRPAPYTDRPVGRPVALGPEDHVRGISLITLLNRKNVGEGEPELARELRRRAARRPETHGLPPGRAVGLTVQQEALLLDVLDRAREGRVRISVQFAIRAYGDEAVIDQPDPDNIVSTQIGPRMDEIFVYFT